MTKGFSSGRQVFRRAAAEDWFGRLLGAATRLSRADAWSTAALALLVTAAGDYLTGVQLWFGPAYLIVICFSSWVLGLRAGISVGLGCMIAGVAVNGATVYPFGPVEVAWNIAMRVAAIVLVVALVAGFRRSYDREWLSARTDQLTGALTKRGFLERAEALGSCAESGVLAYLDLDGFKAINDRHGHAAGDQVLRDFALTVSASLRAGDLFARIGGDEFLIYMRSEEREGCRALKSLHRRLNATASDRPRVRCSIGALILPAGRRISDDEIARADRLMYSAKTGGHGLEIGSAKDKQTMTIAPKERFAAELAG